MPNFTSNHRSKMSDPTRITKNQVERGQIAKIAYKKADGTRGDYYVFILQSKYKGYFHCLDLKYIQPLLMVKLAEDLNEVASTSSRVKKLDLTKLRIDESSKGFYISEIRHKKLQVGYRTLIEKNISSIILYNYDYGVFDKIPSKAEQVRTEAVRRDDNDADSLSTG
jgi:hypothetical protein